MKNAIKIITGIIIILGAFLVGDKDLEQLIIKKDYNFNENSCADSIICIIKDINQPDLYIKVGNNRFGVKHIIARHFEGKNTYMYYNNTEPGTTFPKGTNLNDVIKGIQEVYILGDRVKSNSSSNIAYEKQMEIHGEEATYRLIIRTCDYSLVTFYKRQGSEVVD